jgi:hypothetical protein
MANRNASTAWTDPSTPTTMPPIPPALRLTARSRTSVGRSAGPDNSVDDDGPGAQAGVVVRAPGAST